MMKNLLPLITLIIGFSAGWALFKSNPKNTKSSKPNSSKSSNEGSYTIGSKSEIGDLNTASSTNRNSQTLQKIITKYSNPAANNIQGMIEFYSNLDREELEAEAAKLEGMSFSDRIIAASLLFSRWGQIDPLEALNFSDKIGFAGRFVRPTILQSWATDDPKSAAKYFDENPEQFRNSGGRWGRGNNSSAAGSIAGEWAKKDFDSALAWAKGLNGNDANSAITSIFRETAKLDPSQAASQLNQIAKSKELYDKAVTSIASEWARVNPSQAESWARSLNSEQQSSALVKVYESMSATDPFGAADKINNLSSPDDQKELVETIASNMSKSDPAETIKWIDSLDPSLISANAIRRPISALASVDDTAARAWIDNQPSSDIRDRAAMTYIYSNRNDNPETVLAIASSIENDNRAVRAENITLSRWYRDNPEQAESYMQQVELENERIERVKRWAQRGY